MNSNYSDIMVSRLLEENRILKQKLLAQEEQKINENVVQEKINTIQFIFSAFENCKNAFNSNSINLYGSFLEKLVYKKQMNSKDDLCFYFSNIQVYSGTVIRSDTRVRSDTREYDILKFFNILDSLDFFVKTKYIHNSYNRLWVYNIIKNNVKFRINIYDNINMIPKVYFNLQNIQYSSTCGLTIKHESQKDPKNISLLKILQSNYTNKAINLSKNIGLNSLLDYIKNEDDIMDLGFEINSGIKSLIIPENCAICYEKNVKGLYLSCQHTFCRECIKKHLKNTESKNCPLCRSDLNIIFD